MAVMLAAGALAVAAVGAALVVSSSSAALAGEVDGTGGIVPARDKAMSRCAFSGLQDSPLSPGTTQNWGTIIRVAGPLGNANDTMGENGRPNGCNAVLYPNK